MARKHKTELVSAETIQTGVATADQTRIDNLLVLIEKMERTVYVLNSQLSEVYDELMTMKNGERNYPELREPTPFHITDRNTVLKSRKPKMIRLPDGELKVVKTWRAAVDLILKDCSKSEKRMKVISDMSDKIAGKTRMIVSKDRDRMDSPIEIGDGIYFETHYGTDTLFDVMKKYILEPTGYDYQNVLIYLWD